MPTFVLGEGPTLTCSSEELLRAPGLFTVEGLERLGFSKNGVVDLDPSVTSGRKIVVTDNSPAETVS